MGWIVLAPVLVPLVAAALSLVAYRRIRLQRAVALAGAVGLLGAGVALLVTVRSDGPTAVAVGGWPAPFGIVMVADLLSALMVVLAGIVGTAVVITAFASVGRERERYGFYPLTLVLLTGVAGSFLTGDLFNLYVWFEVMLIASFVLLVLGSERPQVEGAVKYVTLNLFASMLFLIGAGLLYGLTGTLNMAQLSGAVPEVDQGLRVPVAMLFLVAFAIKAGAFPLFAWLPASYHTPPAAVSALFAGLLTKVGVYALLRVFTLVFADDREITHTVIGIGAVATMVVGVLGAVAQHEIRRILSFHIVSQIGYMLVGLALFAPLALAASIFYVAHHILVKTSLFLVAGVVQHVRGSGELALLGGMARTNAGIAILFALPALSLAGIPPFSGFVAKVAIVRSSFDDGAYLLAATALGVSLLTIFSMLKIWNEAFLKTPVTEPAAERPRVPAAMLLPLTAMVAASLAVAFAAAPLHDLALDAADGLLDPSAYVSAVLGEPQ